jgi:LacI family transcriptional regulator
VVVWDTRTDGAKEREALGVLSHQADAVMGYFKNDDEVLARYLGGLPLVLLERGPQQTRFAAVGIDAAAGLEQGIAHLVRAGHRRIGMLDGDRLTPGPRREAFLAEVRRHGLPVDDGWIAMSNGHGVAGGEAAMEQLLDARPQVTAVFGFNDLIAVGAMRAARRRGRWYRRTWPCWASTGSPWANWWNPPSPPCGSTSAGSGGWPSSRSHGCGPARSR